jgi:hypothetical protein
VGFSTHFIKALGTVSRWPCGALKIGGDGKQSPPLKGGIPVHNVSVWLGLLLGIDSPDSATRRLGYWELFHFARTKLTRRVAQYHAFEPSPSHWL